MWLHSDQDITEAVVQRCSVKKVFLKISQNSQENTCASVSQVHAFSCEFCEIFKNTYFNRTPPVAAADVTISALCFGFLIFFDILIANKWFTIICKITNIYIRQCKK